MTELMRRMIESKRQMRREFAAAPIAEKLRILERLRNRDGQILAARANKPTRPVRPKM